MIITYYVFNDNVALHVVYVEAVFQHTQDEINNNNDDNNRK